MNDFYECIYQFVAHIPPGHVATYGRIAALAGRPRAARQVGRALWQCPDGRHLPCHRVVNRFGELAPSHVFGGEGLQRSQLEQEGVAFLPDGRIDLQKHIWNF
ncbi:MAG: methylated-DNA--[protein]-cysteine S-methyltransferase [Oscillospiraceae bacterium]|nr:methylated-DNA--[protein]-cysteine S-methyltransferase [Oscillospiraceae bacterium]